MIKTQRDAEKHEARQQAEIRMLRRALNAALDRVDELERECASAWDAVRESGAQPAGEVA
jgi:hypothetical protein